MRKKWMLLSLPAALWMLLAGCGTNLTASMPPEPAPMPELHSPYPQEPPREQETLEETPDVPEPDGIAAQYVGVWRDTGNVDSGGQCRMQISCTDGIYSIDISWNGGAGENSRWLYTGTYDEIWEGIDYIGSRYEENTREDGSAEWSAALEEATGLIYLSEDGTMLWEDTFEHRGDGLRFLREE